jgi:multidrug efflux pump subunit AcrA (membrane-fusion protein)
MSFFDCIGGHAVRAISGLMFVCAVAGCAGTPPAAEETAPPAPVKWETARLVFLEEWTELLGTTIPLPDHAARVTAPVEGRVQSILGDGSGKPIVEGQHVEAGDIIVQLDDRIIRDNRDKAIASQQALEAELTQAEAARRLAAVDVKRLQPLLNAQRLGTDGGHSGRDMGLISPVEVEKAQLALEDAESRVRATRARIVAGQKEVESSERQLALYKLRAPRKGRLGRILVVPGQTLSVGAAVADIIDLEDEIDVLAYVSPTTVNTLALGQTTKVGGLDHPSDTEGKLVFIADQAEPETGSFAVKARFPNREAKLRANLSLPIRVLTRPGKECLAVPESALMEDLDPPGVLVVEDVRPEKNAEGKEQQVGKARRLSATIGIRDRILHQVEITRLEDKEKKWKGTLEEALFIVEKGQGLQTGDPVKLEEEEEE